jgi:hypothetical protein
MTDRPTFELDNIAIQNAPSLLAAKRDELQLYLPGMEPPFSVFDIWVLYACYYHLDPADPTAEVTVSKGELLKILQAGRLISGYTSQDYRALMYSFYRWFSCEARNLDYEQVKTKRGYKTLKTITLRRMLITLKFKFAEGVTEPHLLPPDKRKNVNPITVDPLTGKPAPPVFMPIDEPDTIAITYRMHPDAVKGSIGKTITPTAVFKLRQGMFGRSETAFALLFWVLRQTAKTTKRRLLPDPKERDKKNAPCLFNELRLNHRQPGRGRAAILKALALLKDEGVVAEWSLSKEDGQEWVTITKADDWHFASQTEKRVRAIRRRKAS